MSKPKTNDPEGRELSTTVWTALDRKAGAIIELTIKQLRNKTSTWTVIGVSMLLLVLLSAFYIDSVREGFESIDNDGDSVDYDGDGYPLGKKGSTDPVTSTRANTLGPDCSSQRARYTTMVLGPTLAITHGTQMAHPSSRAHGTAFDSSISKPMSHALTQSMRTWRTPHIPTGPHSLA